MSKQKKYHFIDILFAVLLVFYAMTLLKASDHCLWVDEARDGFFGVNFFKEGLTLNYSVTPSHNRYIYFFIEQISSLIITDPVLGITLPSIILTLLLILATYLIVDRIIKNKPLALLAAGITAINPLTTFLATRALSDIPYVSFVILGYYFFNKKYYEKDDAKINKNILLSAICLGSALHVKETGIFAIIPLGIYALFMEREKVFNKKNYKFAGYMMIFYALLFVSNYVFYGNLLGEGGIVEMITKDPSEVFDGGPRSFYYFNLANIFTPTIMILFFMVIPGIFMVKNKETHSYSLLLIVYFIFFTLWPVKVHRYSYMFIPLVSILFVIGLNGYLGLIKKNLNLDVTVLSYFALLLLFLQMPVYEAGLNSIQQRATGFCGFEEAGAVISKLPQVGIIPSASYWQLRYFSMNKNLVAIPSTQEEFQEGIQSGTISFFVFDKWERTQPSWLVDEVSSGRYPLIYPQTPTQEDMVFIFSNPNTATR